MDRAVALRGVEFNEVKIHGVYIGECIYVYM